MSEIPDLMASNDPMGTPVMALGPPPPMNTTPDFQQPLHMQMQPPETEPMQRPVQKAAPKTSHLGLPNETKVSIVVASVAFLVLLPNVQQMLLAQLPVLANNATLHTMANSILIGVLFFYMRDNIMDLI